MSNDLSVLHVDTGTKWRGGQAQVFNLLTHFPSSSLNNHLLIPPSSPLSDRLRQTEARVRLHEHPLRGEWDLSAAWTVRSLDSEHDYDLIHCHSSHALGITWVASLFTKLPPFIQTRRLETTVGDNFLSRMKYTATNHHIANSETVRGGLLKSGINEEAITVIPSGINLEKINEADPNPSFLENFGFDPDKPVIGNVGALCEQKDQETFIKAAAQVLGDHPTAQFLIAGEGELRNELEELIAELGVKSNVKLLGFVEDIFGLMKTFDLFVLTSRFEGLCGTILQAMACELPVISSNVKGSEQILKDGETCTTISIGSIEEFSNEISSFLTNPTPYQERIPDAKSTAEKYDYSNLSNRYVTFYKSLTEEK